MKNIRNLLKLAAVMIAGLAVFLCATHVKAQTTNFPTPTTSGSNAPVYGTNSLLQYSSFSFIPTETTGGAFPNGDIIPANGTNLYYTYIGSSNIFAASATRSRFSAFNFIAGSTNTGASNAMVAYIDFSTGNGDWTPGLTLSNYLPGAVTNGAGTNIDMGGWLFARLNRVVASTNSGPAAQPAVVGTNFVNYVGMSDKPNTGF